MGMPSANAAEGVALFDVIALCSLVVECRWVLERGITGILFLSTLPHVASDILATVVLYAV